MTLDDYNTFCDGLPHTTHVVQWGGSHVWKVGGKVFVIGGSDDGVELARASFKVPRDSFELMRDMPGLRGAPHLASRGMSWIQRTSDETLSDADLKAYLEASHRLVASGLTKKLQRELGFLEG